MTTPLPPGTAPAAGPAAAGSVDRASLTRFAWLSIAAALVTMAMKTVAYLLTGSVGLLSDAVESTVNLVGGVMALAMLKVAARPADEDHAFGHAKAEYFSSGVEGSLILVAAASIAVAAVRRLLAPQPLEQVGLGLAVSVGASLVNLGVALVLLRVGRRRRSITLEANAHHLLTDVWTSVGVLAGVGAVAWTGWQRLDPLVALAVAANIVFDRCLDRPPLGPRPDGHGSARRRGRAGPRRPAGLRAGGCRSSTRCARARPAPAASSRCTCSSRAAGPSSGDTTCSSASRRTCARALPEATVFTHLEPLEDPASFDDQLLERRGT